MMRNVQGSSFSGYEVWDVTDVRAPVLLSALRNLRATHKHWWECKSGIAYLPGSKDASWGVPLWRTDQSMVIVDWSDPSGGTPANRYPKYIRTFGPVGAQPGSTVTPVPPDLHGAIGTYDHFDARGNRKNRIYAAYGVGDDGILLILDREKLLTPAYGGTYTGSPDTPTDEELLSAQVSRMDMSPDQGGHTSMPVFGLVPPSYQNFTSFKTRDVVLLASESTNDRCDEAPHWSFVVDVTTETRPWSLATMWVDPRAGEKYPRGNYCTRGARFGVHSSEENFDNPLYGKLTSSRTSQAGRGRGTSASRMLRSRSPSTSPRATPTRPRTAT